MPVITHHNVVFIEIRRRKGLYGGDALVIAENYLKNESYYFLYYAYEPYKLNMYKLSKRLVISSIEFDPKLIIIYGIRRINKLKQDLLLEGKCKLDPIEEENYPSIKVAFNYDDDPIKLKLYIYC